jgi:hypothetical protein
MRIINFKAVIHSFILTLVGSRIKKYLRKHFFISFVIYSTVKYTYFDRYAL